MKGDISADFHAPDKRFSGARAQSGRVLTESDFNVALDVIDNTLEDLVRTLLCAAGSPDSGLKVMSASAVTVTAPDGTVIPTYEVEVAPGTFVLGGRASRLQAPIGSLDQSEWLSQILTPGVLPPAPAAGRTDLVWVEQVERAVRAVEDREIQERALGSADTTTRLRPQIRVAVLPDVPPECHLAFQTLTQTLIAGGHATSEDGSEIKSVARLGIAFVGAGATLDPCAPAGAVGYLGAENHMLKVMLTAPDRFVWAFDHGEPLYRVLVDAANGEIEFVTEPRDPVLYPLPDQVIEILPWDVLLPNAEKAAAPLGHFARITGHYDPPTRRIAYDGTMPPAWQDWLDDLPDAVLGRADDPPRFFYARVWQTPTVGTAADQPTGTAIDLPETGLSLHFTGNGIAGDYWSAALRPNEPELIQPWNLMIDPAAGEVPIAPPIGPRRFFALLGLITWPATLTPPVIHDCRNRFRRLCRIKSCCTYQVGDGHISYGDFNTIQEAVDALPAEGGEICLLTGTHEGAIDLRGRSGIRIHGCGIRTQVDIAADPANPGRPGVWLDGAQDIGFSDFAISGAGGPVFGAAEHCQDIHFHRLTIVARQTGAIVLVDADRVFVTDCRITAQELPAAVTPTDLLNLLPLIFLAGETLRIERNAIIAVNGGFNRNRVALGGIQIGGDSSDINIEDNRIEGGNGHGITLGSLIFDRGDDGGIRIIVIPPWLTIDEDGCVKLQPGGTIVIDRPPNVPPPRSAGLVRQLRIRDNLILDHGGCGISVAHWFIATGGAEIQDLDDIEIDEVEIDDNRIHGCMQINLVSALPVDAAFNSGFGGIALASATDITIQANEIRDCGGNGRSPICGIYIRYAERLRIIRNRISDNGRPASLTDPLLVGNIGGIVIGHVDGVQEQLGVRVREVVAAQITGNTVVSPEGRALEMAGTGQMMVQGNALTTHGNNIGGVLLMLLFALLRTRAAVGESITSEQIEGQYRAAISQIGAATVLILNTGVDPNVALLSAAPSAYIDKGTHASAFQPGSDLSSAARAPSDILVGKGRDPEGRSGLPQGPVSFSDNMVLFDGLSNAITIALSSVAIVSMDDVGMHDNHCSVILGNDIVLANAVVFGLVSARVIGNRFSEILPLRGGDPVIPRTILSAATFGILNATELNQGTHCFLVIGLKKPRIVAGGAQGAGMLDTNRHLLADEFCAVFQKIGSGFGDG